MRIHEFTLEQERDHVIEDKIADLKKIAAKSLYFAELEGMSTASVKDHLEDYDDLCLEISQLQEYIGL